jgi:hypothetical protein
MRFVQLAGAFLLVATLAGCSSGTSGGPSVVGKWELTEKHEGGLDRRTWQFNPGGTGTFRIHKEYKGKVQDSTGSFDYKLIDGNPPTLEMKLTRAEGAATDRMKRELGQTVRFKVGWEGDSLRLTKPETGDSLPLKRIR